MKTAGRENPNRWTKASSKSSTWRGSSEQILLHQVGCEARKSPAGVGVFFLDFPFYRTYRTRGDCQSQRKSYKAYQTVGWVVGWEFLGKTALNATLHGQ
jgi:hypothetical protein